MNKDKLLNIAIITLGAIAIFIFSLWGGYIWGHTAYQPDTITGFTYEQAQELCQDEVKDCPKYKPCEKDLTELYREVERLQLFEQMQTLKDEVREKQMELNIKNQ